MYIKAGMIVRVIRGNHRGEEGKVLNISPIEKDGRICRPCLYSSRNKLIIEIKFIFLLGFPGAPRAPACNGP